VVLCRLLNIKVLEKVIKERLVLVNKHLVYIENVSKCSGAKDVEGQKIRMNVGC
jgi:hypothetical protein